MPCEAITITTADGECPTHICTPNGEGPWPAAILYMDAGGIRPTALEMAQHLADAGYAVLLPDPFYRYGPYGPLVPKDVFAGDVGAILGPLLATTSTAKAAEDTGAFPRGIGLEVSGLVKAVGVDVTDVSVGDRVLGTADYAGCTSAGASDYAIMNHWTRIPAGLDLVDAAALPMAVETAFRSLDNLGVATGNTLLVHGAGTTVGFAAVQIALMRGARVFATAGETFADRLRTFGATVTSYGDGMVDRVLEIAGGALDLVLDTAPDSGALPGLIKIAGGDPRHVFTITDFAAAQALGVRHSFGEDATLRYDVLGDFAQRAADGKFTVPVAQTFALEDWRAALHISQSGHAHGKLLLLTSGKVVSG